MKKPFQKTTNLIHIFNQLKTFIKPYKWMVFGTLALTFIGALFAQVNPIVLKYTVDEVTKLTQLPHPILDEPTASLDAIATEQIKNSLDAIKKDRTVIIISHSLSQILDSDMIYVMKKGEVVENGTHEELYEKDGTYRQIFEASARSLNLDRLVKTYKDE